jgi:plasmid replication initiation protein
MTSKTASQHKVDDYEINGDRPQGEQWVVLSNSLTKAGHGLTLSEKRIVMMAVSKLDSQRYARPGESPVVKLTAADYAESFGVDPDTAYDQLQSAAKNLYERSITFLEPPKGRRKTPAVVKMRWVGSVKYHEGEGWCELHFWHQVVPHLMGIRTGFTHYQLKQASALRSVYSWRLLELLAKFETTGWAQYTVEDFATAMDAPPSMQTDFGQVKRRIIEPAVKELIQKDGWLIEWEPIKAGRKVQAVKFVFRRNPQGSLNI